MFFPLDAPFYFRAACHAGATSMAYPHFHDQYEVYFLLDGRKEYAVAGTVLSLEADSLLLVNRGVLHRAQSPGPEPHRMAVLNFSAPFLERFAGCPAVLALDQPFDCRLARLSPDRRSWQDRLLTELSGWTGADGRLLPDADPALLQCRLYELLLELDRLREKADWRELSLSRGSPLEALQQVVQFVADHYGQPLRLDELARRFGYGEGYLSQQLKRYLGMRFSQYLTALRMEEACRLLRDTGWPVGRIAEAVGYGSAAYFADCFARRMGCSPTAYRHRSGG